MARRLQLKAENRGFSVEGFDPGSARILAEIQRKLVPHDPNPISAELYAVNVYSQGGHFAPHKDTPRGDDMFGTLVVCLPSQFSSGKLVVSHRGIVQKFDWGRAIEKQKTPNQLHWAAFFGDVDHQIERIWSAPASPWLTCCGAAKARRTNERVPTTSRPSSGRLESLVGRRELSARGWNSRLPLLPSLPPGRALSGGPSPLDCDSSNRLKGTIISWQ